MTKQPEIETPMYKATAVNSQNEALSGWESNFMKSITKSLSYGASLSEKQMAVLDKLYKRTL